MTEHFRIKKQTYFPVTTFAQDMPLENTKGHAEKAQAFRLGLNHANQTQLQTRQMALTNNKNTKQYMTPARDPKQCFRKPA